MGTRLGLLTLVAILSSDTAAMSKEPIQLVPDVTYSKVGTTELKLDLAIPAEKKGPYPLVLCVHGGGWRMGHRRDLRPLLQMLAQEGYVAASVSYRFAPEFQFPAPIQDCKTAVRFLRSQAETYRIDPERIGALGYSAGGHLVCLLGTTSAMDEFEGTEYRKHSSKVQAVISYFGPTDLPAFANDESCQNAMLGPLLGGKFKEKPEAYKKASPLEYVSKESPPFLFLHGTRDWVVPIDHSRKMANKLKEVGVATELLELAGEAHGWGGAKVAYTNRATLDFLGKTLRK